MRMRNNKNDHAFKTYMHGQWRFILTSVEVSLELLILYISCERHEGSLSEKAHRVGSIVMIATVEFARALRYIVVRRYDDRNPLGT